MNNGNGLPRIGFHLKLRCLVMSVLSSSSSSSLFFIVEFAGSVDQRLTVLLLFSFQLIESESNPRRNETPSDQAQVKDRVELNPRSTLSSRETNPLRLTFQN